MRPSDYVFPEHCCENCRFTQTTNPVEGLMCFHGESDDESIYVEMQMLDRSVSEAEWDAQLEPRYVKDGGYCSQWQPKDVTVDHPPAT